MQLLVPASGMHTQEDLFDWVSFPLRPNGTEARSLLPLRHIPGGPREVGMEVGRTFPRAMWRTTEEWAADWAGFTRTRSPPPRPAHVFANPAAALRALRLPAAAMRSLGLRQGYCAVTDSVSSLEDAHRLYLGKGSRFFERQGAKGGVRLSALVDGTWPDMERPYQWGDMIEACTRFCRSAPGCRFVTLSAEFNDCSFYRSCDAPMAAAAEFYWRRVPASTSETEVSDAEVEGAQMPREGAEIALPHERGRARRGKGKGKGKGKSAY